MFRIWEGNQILMQAYRLLKLYSDGKRNFRSANLVDANLKYANLKCADLESANLGYADLKGADLENACLKDTYLVGANLKEANFECACLENADLENADLENACLENACLINAYLDCANLIDAAYTIPQVLQANWGEVSDSLCLALMRLDCESLPNGTKLFADWVANDNCPFSDQFYGRIASFKEKSSLWKPGRPPSLWNIWKQLAKEKWVKISGVKQ